MSDFVRPIKTTTLSDAWGLLQRHEFDLRRRNGQWQHQIRETYDRGDGAAVLLCDVSDTSVVLTRQFRYPAYYRGETPFLLDAMRKIACNQRCRATCDDSKMVPTLTVKGLRQA